VSSLNRVQIIGNLGRDPEIRATSSGDKMANLSVAVTDRWTDRSSGERRERTEWIRCVAFGQLADIMERFLRKGSKIYAEGRLQTRRWQDQSGQDRYSTEVVMQGFDGKLVMLDSRQDGGQQRDSYNAPADDLDDHVPF